MSELFSSGVSDTEKRVKILLTYGHLSIAAMFSCPKLLFIKFLLPFYNGKRIPLRRGSTVASRNKITNIYANYEDRISKLLSHLSISLFKLDD